MGEGDQIIGDRGLGMLSADTSCFTVTIFDLILDRKGQWQTGYILVIRTLEQYQRVADMLTFRDIAIFCFVVVVNVCKSDNRNRPPSASDKMIQRKHFCDYHKKSRKVNNKNIKRLMYAAGSVYHHMFSQ